MCVYVVFSCNISIQTTFELVNENIWPEKKNINTKIAYNHTFLIQQFVRLVFPFDFALERLERYKLWNSYLFKYTISFFCADVQMIKTKLGILCKNGRNNNNSCVKNGIKWQW